MVNLLRWIFPSGADYALLICCLVTAIVIVESILAIIDAWPAAAAEFRELEAQRRHRRLLAKLKGK